MDRLLDDPVFFEPFVAFFDPEIGRPSIPMETYLRMMFLRFRYRLGFETLCAEVADSLAWRRFCRIGLADAVPHPEHAHEDHHPLRGPSRRAVERGTAQKGHGGPGRQARQGPRRYHGRPANVAYPTDSGLLAKGVAKFTKTVGAIKATGLARRTRFRDRTRSVRRRAHQIAAWLRRRSGDAKDEVLGLTGELASIAESAVKDAQVVAINARRGLRRAGDAATGKATALVAELEGTIATLDQVIGQTRIRLSGEVPDGATRLVSLHDTDARPIRKGRLGKPVEFGYKAQVTDNFDGIVVDHNVEKGNPFDAPMLVPAITRITSLFGKLPRAVTADRGYGEAKSRPNSRPSG